MRTSLVVLLVSEATLAFSLSSVPMAQNADPRRLRVQTRAVDAESRSEAAAGATVDAESGEVTDSPAVELLDVEVSDFDEWAIKWGFKEDPRVPEECRVDALTRIKESGTAGAVAYAITEAGFWVGSVPFAAASIYAATGALPDWTTEEGKEALGGAAFVLINFARVIVPARIALALALAPWVDETIIRRFTSPRAEDLTAADCLINYAEISAGNGRCFLTFLEMLL